MDEDLIGEIIRNEDNIKSIALAEVSKGAGNHLTDWLRSQEKALPELTSERPDVGEKAQHAVVNLLEALKTGTSDEGIKPLRAALRVAHRENWREFQQTFQCHVEGKKKIASHSTHVRIVRRHTDGIDCSMKKNRRKSSTRSSYFGNVWGEMYTNVKIPLSAAKAMSSMFYSFQDSKGLPISQEQNLSGSACSVVRNRS
jgi:hypothetical protein